MRLIACQRKADTAPGRRAIFCRANGGGGFTEYISESEPRKCHFYFWFRPLFILCFGVTVRNQLFAEYFLKNDVKLRGSTSLDVSDGFCPPTPQTCLVRPCGASLQNAACVELRHRLALETLAALLICFLLKTHKSSGNKSPED